MAKTTKQILASWRDDTLPEDMPVRKGKNAYPSVKHIDKKRRERRGYRKHK